MQCGRIFHTENSHKHGAFNIVRKVSVLAMTGRATNVCDVIPEGGAHAPTAPHPWIHHDINYLVKIA